MFARLAGWVTCLMVMHLIGTPAQAGPPADIRGLDFATPPGGAYQGIEIFGGLLRTSLGDLPASTNSNGGATMFDGTIPNTFQVIADPAAPDDPTQIHILTRFTTGASRQFGRVGPLFWELAGTYDPTTGTVSASGSQTGVITFYSASPSDPLGFPIGDVELLLQVTDPSYSLNGVASVANDGTITITGTDPAVPAGGPGTNITFTNNTLGDFQVLFTPAGDLDPNDAILAFPILPGSEYAGFYNWTAIAAP
ncbi:MAG TPA: hypothetical protein VKU02_33845 [Gemmataceae bacterium]|nr:hypothetical protein [Gemmataceae bacterium]